DEKITDAWIGMGSVLDELGKTNEGINCILKALRLEPLNSEYWYVLGDAQMKAGLITDALDSYKKVSQFDGANPDIWLDYSDAYMKLNDIEMAVEIIIKGIEQQPENTSQRYRLAAYLLKSGNNMEAFETLETSLQLDYNRNIELLEYDASFASNLQILDLIELYKK
ncbi:MAG: tetratricopeptide repeat protein, partial [Bacteroidota bacterium]